MPPQSRRVPGALQVAEEGVDLILILEDDYATRGDVVMAAVDRVPQARTLDLDRFIARQQRDAFVASASRLFGIITNAHL